MITATRNGDDLFRQAICAWESALESGETMREESAKWLQDLYSHAQPVSQWYEKAQAMADEATAKAYKNMDEAMRAINQQAELTVKLYYKALETRQGNDDADTNARLAEWWDMAMESIRMNSQAVLKANSFILAAWCELAHKVNNDATDAVSELSLKTAEQAEKMANAAAVNLENMLKHVAAH
jgi:hypothetical protein